MIDSTIMPSDNETQDDQLLTNQRSEFVTYIPLENGDILYKLHIDENRQPLLTQEEYDLLAGFEDYLDGETILNPIQESLRNKERQKALIRLVLLGLLQPTDIEGMNTINNYKIPSIEELKQQTLLIPLIELMENEIAKTSDHKGIKKIITKNLVKNGILTVESLILAYYCSIRTGTTILKELYQYSDRAYLIIKKIIKTNPKIKEIENIELNKLRQLVKD